jgi:hypothetical protein
VTDEQRRRERLQQRLPREPGVERLEAPGRSEQQRRALAAADRGERDLGEQLLGPCTLELVERPRLRRRQQPLRLVERAGLVLGVRGA